MQSVSAFTSAVVCSLWSRRPTTRLLGLSLTFARSRTANIFDLVRIYFAIVRRFCESWFWWRSVNVTLAASVHGYFVSSFDERKHQEWVPLYYRLVHFRLPSKWLKCRLFYMAVEPVLNCVRYFTSRTFLSSMFVCNLKYHWLLNKANMRRCYPRFQVVAGKPNPTTLRMLICFDYTKFPTTLPSWNCPE